MVHKRLNVISFPEKEWSGRKKHSPLKGDLEVTAYKEAEEYYPGEEQRTVLLVDPDFEDMSDRFFTVTTSRLETEIDYTDKTINLNLLGHGNPERDTIVVRSFTEVLKNMKAVEELSTKTMKLEHIVFEFYCCYVDELYRYYPFLDEIKKLARFGIPLVFAFGGVHELLTTDQFMYSQIGYPHSLDMRDTLAKYSFATFNGAEIVSMRCDFNHLNKFQIKQKQTYLMLSPHTGRGVWTSGSENWWDMKNMRLGIDAPRICFYKHLIRSSSGIPEECETMKAWDFMPHYVPKFVKN